MVAARSLPWRIEEWPEAARMDYGERAAILEYDARMPRARAEAIAEEWIRRDWRHETEWRL